MDSLAPANLTTTLVATYGQNSSVYLIALTTYYLHLLLYYPLAYILNQSYILHHPDELLPVSITPAQNQTI